MHFDEKGRKSQNKRERSTAKGQDIDKHNKNK